MSKHAHAPAIDYLAISINAAAALMLGEIRRASRNTNTLEETIEHTKAAAIYATRLSTLIDFKEYTNM